MSDFMNPPANAVIGPGGPAWLSDEGIIIAVLAEGYTGSSIHTREHALEHLKINRGIAAGKKRPLLVDITQMRNMQRGAREAYVDPANDEFVSAVALITASTISRMVANLFINIQKQRVPIKMFNDYEKAREWLMTFM